MRNKIDYGIDLGTTNSAIARMENGTPTIKKSDTLKDTLPSCVHFNKKKDTLVGDTAFNVMKNDNTRALKIFEAGKTNTYIEFKRTMGTTHKYESANMNREFSSEELSAEVLKKLKSFIQDENISSIVITVPAKFLNPQKNATIQAAKLAGFKHIELLQEPVAAATVYGLTTKNKDGYWLVFDFGGGTFDAAIVKSEEGILTVKDTDGDNWLGGKNLDEAIVDKIIIPFLHENYAINNIVKDSTKKEILRNAVKSFAEEAKIQLSFKDSHNILSNLGDLPFVDEKGEEPEIDITLTQKDMEKVLAPIFQKAIDIANGLLKRNNLNGSDLGALILVGGPTHSPILRRMLKEQITENVDTTVDPMTVVAKGAALFASTISVSEAEKEENRDKTKLQLDIKYEATTVEMEEMVSIKILRNKIEGTISEKIFADVMRGDGAWSSGKKQIGEKATLIDVLLQEGCFNVFTINVYDEQGNKLECQPSQFDIRQGGGGIDTVLPYNIGIGKWFDEYEKDLFKIVKGLEKNKKLPATGVINGLKTRIEIRPGISKDVIRIPIYQGDYDAEGTNPILNNLVNEVIISGNNLPKLLPEGSAVDITIKVDRNEQMYFSAYFPLIDHPEELNIHIRKTEPPTEEKLKKNIANAKGTARNVSNMTVFEKLEELENQLENEKGSADGKMKILDGLRKELLKLDEVDKLLTFKNIEKELKERFFFLEHYIETLKQSSLGDKLNMNQVEIILSDIRKNVDVAINNKNIKEVKMLIDEINGFGYNLENEATDGYADIRYLQYYSQNFNTLKWKDATKARQLINQTLQQVGNKNINSLIIEIDNLLIRENQQIEYTGTIK